MKNLIFICLCVFQIVLLSCATYQKAEPKKHFLVKKIDTTAIFKNSHQGVFIYEPDTKKTIYAKNQDKYFVPASNTKILTLYACLKSLGDSIPALKYVEKNDSLFILGTSDPTFLHPDFPKSKTLDFLKKSKTVVFSDANFGNASFGKGWAWDDYNDYYQPEISVLPLYGNIVRISNPKGVKQINPPFFRPFFQPIEGDSLQEIKRKLNENTFLTNKGIDKKMNFAQDIPFITSTKLTADLLSDTLKRSVVIKDWKTIQTPKTLFSLPVDTVYRRMMQESDNMLAEHLLLLAGSKYSETISTELSIKAVQDLLFNNLPQKLNWVDGSGLSRYNLFTPRSLVKVLEKMWTEFPKEKIYSYMSIGGKTGTLKKAYSSQIPFIFAKSGSLSGVYNQSGYLITKSGRTFIFSFMNNNFEGSTSKYRVKLSEILTWVHENY
jgi:serine-type D-Ala-D-Ala carboxypeptidase/endopeptidase (penicillin-binding protein 4)